MTTEPANGLLVYSNRDRSGVLRLASNSYASGHNDVFVPASIIEKYAIRPADRVIGNWLPAKDKQSFRTLTDVISINDKSPEESRNRPHFDDLTPVYPDKQLKLEDKELTGRVIDLVAPIGYGQRMLIVAPPKAGKTMCLQAIARSIQAKYPKATLIALLIDERPEEVTDFREAIKGQVIASTFDEQPERHVEVAEIVVHRARRLAEMKGDVVILLDSITRLARAYNTITPPSSRIMSGGLDARALPAPKKLLGAARNLREGGSITIIGTTLVDTGSKMDEVIFEEFKGTGNSEIHLDRRLMEKRIFPCIDIARSGTRREELLLDKFTKERMWEIRKTLPSGDATKSMEAFKKFIEKYKTNEEFLRAMV